MTSKYEGYRFAACQVLLFFLKFSNFFSLLLLIFLYIIAVLIYYEYILFIQHKN